MYASYQIPSFFLAQISFPVTAKITFILSRQYYSSYSDLQYRQSNISLSIQIAYYAGLRIGEACGLAQQDVNLEKQCLTIRRSIRYDGSRHKNIIEPTKRKKVRIVDFGDTLTEIRITNEATPKDVQELLGHSDVSTTMNVYAHSTRKAKRESARLLDKVAGND